MNVIELAGRLADLIIAGHGDEEVFLDTGPDTLFTIGEVDLDSDGVGVIIWKV